MKMAVKAFCKIKKKKKSFLASTKHAISTSTRISEETL